MPTRDMVLTTPAEFVATRHVQIYPAMLTCFGCRQQKAYDLPLNALVYVFPLTPFGFGYIHKDCQDRYDRGDRTLPGLKINN